jgi:cellulose synthase/poly-beta-1,6-N-acetylglucosamine synthase-like glycosyltransferase
VAEEFLRRSPGNAMTEPALSVVVIGRNEGARLVRCLESVRNMRWHGAIELIYCDSNSSDGSADRAAALGIRVVEIGTGRLSAARARNAGWQPSSAPFILFLDGDTILHPDFVTNALARFDDDPRIAVVWGHRRETHPEASLYNRILDLDWIYEPGFSEFCGGDAIMRRFALQRAGGFNPDLIAGEEPDLCRRIRADGGLILHIDTPMTGHDLAMTSWRQYWRRAIRAGHAYAEIAALYRNTADPFWTGTSRSNAIRAYLYLLAPASSILIALLLRSWVPVLLLLPCIAAVIVRTAIRTRQKHASVATVILFAVHSHFQQIPIFVGQLRYRMIAGRHGRSELIEYRRPI